MIEIYRNFFRGRRTSALVLMLSFMLFMSVYGTFTLWAVNLDAFALKVIFVSLVWFGYWVVLPAVFYIIDTSDGRKPR